MSDAGSDKCNISRGNERKSMYRKDSQEWLKHIDFILLDLICLQAAFLLAYAASGYGFHPYRSMLYRNVAVILECIDLFVIFFNSTMSGVLKRGYYKEFTVTVKNALIVAALTILYLFALQQGQNYSRLALFLMIPIYVVITYLTRLLLKSRLKKQMEEGTKTALLIITSQDIAHRVVKSMKENNFARYVISGVALVDADWVGNVIEGIPVVAGTDDIPEYICNEWIDEALIVISDDLPYPKELIRVLTETGVTTHLNLAKITSMQSKKNTISAVNILLVNNATA